MIRSGGVISDAFSTEKDYEIGNYCIYLNGLYKFTSPKPAGAWDGTKVVPCTIGQEIGSLNGSLDNVSKRSLGGITNPTDKKDANLYTETIAITIGSGGEWENLPPNLGNSIAGAFLCRNCGAYIIQIYISVVSPLFCYRYSTYGTTNWSPWMKFAIQ